MARPEFKKLKLSSITVDPTIQPREKGLDDDHVAELEEVYRKKAKLPRLVVWLVAEVYCLSQGFHRIAGAERAGLKQLECEVHTGSLEQWKFDAITSNKGHGLKRTNGDKRRAVNMLLDLHPDWTQARVAKAVGVTHPFVAEVLADRSAAAAATGEKVTVTNSDPNEEEKQDTKSQRKSTKRGRKTKKLGIAEKIGRALKEDHERTNEAIAKLVGCKSQEVKKRRAALIKGGFIPDWSPQATNGDQDGTPLAHDVAPPAAPEPAEFDPDDPAVDPRFMPNGEESVLYADHFRNRVARLRSVRSEMRKALSDREHVLHARIDFGNFDASLGELIETLDLNVPEHVCPPCCGTGTDPEGTTCKYCDGYGIVDKHHHDGLKAKWKETRARFDKLRGIE